MEQQARDLQFQHIRNNVTSWLPIKDTDKVWVIEGAIDDSKYAGKYDYVLFLRGLESCSLSDLAKLKTCLTPDGSLILFADNRMGMKYLAGCPEKTTGLIGEGINQYPHNGGARTYDKQEWEEIIKDLGFAYSKFYYPYPDLEYPTEIYTDEWLPNKGALNNNLNNLDNSRLQYWDEAKVFDKAIELGIFPSIANAFIIVLENPVWTDRELEPVYIRYSNDRNPEYAIRTQVVKDNTGCRFVEKLPDTDEAVKHIYNISSNEDKLNNAFVDSCFEANISISIDNRRLYEFVNGQMLEAKLDSYLQHDDMDGFYDLLDRFIAEVQKVSGQVLDIDILLSNVIEIDNIDSTSWIVIDYEWVFEKEALPLDGMDLDFIIYRILHYYYDVSAFRQSKLDRVDLFTRYGLDLDKLHEFSALEADFQCWIDSGYYKLATYKSEKHRPVIDPNELMFATPELKPWSIHTEIEYSDGTICNQDAVVDKFIGTSVLLTYPIWDDLEQKGIIKLTINRPEGISIYAPLLCKVVDSNSVEHQINATMTGQSLDGSFHYMTPQDRLEIIIPDEVVSCGNELVLYLKDKNLDDGLMLFANDKYKERLAYIESQNHQEEYIKQLETNVQHLQGIVDSMQESTSWKVTEPLRKTMGFFNKK